MDKLDLAGELTALLDEAVPAHDLALCFSYTITGEPYHTRLVECKTYEDIRTVLTDMGIELLP
jgi:hypothetical protein